MKSEHLSLIGYSALFLLIFTGATFSLSFILNMQNYTINGSTFATILGVAANITFVFFVFFQIVKQNESIKTQEDNVSAQLESVKTQKESVEAQKANFLPLIKEEAGLEENGEFRVIIANSGKGPAKDVRITLILESEGIEAVQQFSLGPLDIGETFVNSHDDAAGHPLTVGRHYPLNKIIGEKDKIIAGTSEFFDTAEGITRVRAYLIYDNILGETETKKQIYDEYVKIESSGNIELLGIDEEPPEDFKPTLEGRKYDVDSIVREPHRMENSYCIEFENDQDLFSLDIGIDRNI